jgi:hypothetical protein
VHGDQTSSNFLEKGLSMTVLADFEIIPTAFRANIPSFGEVEIGDSPGLNPWKGTFESGGRLADQSGRFWAFITLMVRGIINSGARAEVEINNQSVGAIFSSQNSFSTAWRTQTIVFDSKLLINGTGNQIVIRPALLDFPSPGNSFDNFHIRDVMCFFRQKSD